MKTVTMRRGCTKQIVVSEVGIVGSTWEADVVAVVKLDNSCKLQLASLSLFLKKKVLLIALYE